jgi:Mycothiol maleylpyruvate isomerase N-terminal domain
MTENGPALMAAAAAETARVVTQATKTPLDAETPCPDWDLRTLLNHTILWTSYSADNESTRTGDPAANATMSSAASP